MDRIEVDQTQLYWHIWTGEPSIWLKESACVQNCLGVFKLQTNPLPKPQTDSPSIPYILSKLESHLGLPRHCLLFVPFLLFLLIAMHSPFPVPVLQSLHVQLLLILWNPLDFKIPSDKNDHCSFHFFKYFLCFCWDLSLENAYCSNFWIYPDSPSGF